MKGQCLLIIAFVTLAYSASAGSQSVYKSVDAQGRITYSSSPPPDAAEEGVEQVQIAPGPTEEQRQAAEQRARALQATAKREEQQRQEQADKAKQAKSEADRALREAKTALQEAQMKSSGDWQTLATGGRVLKQSYLDRVEDAQQRVRKAQEQVRSATSTER